DWGWAVAVHPDDLNELVATWQAVLASGNQGEAEARLRQFDGEYRWFLFRANPLRDQSGNIVKWYGTNIDIEDRKRADEALRANERDLYHIINTIPVLAWCNLPDGSNEFLNKPWHDYTGLPPEKAHGWGWQVTIHPDDLPKLLDKWRQLLATGEPGEIEARLRRFDGEYRWFLFRVNPLRDQSGSIVKWYGTNTDIDGRKHAEEELRRSEMLLAEGQRMSSTGTFSWLVDTDELIFSGQLKHIFEFDMDTVVTFDEITGRVHPDDLPLLAEKMAEVRSGRDNAEYDIRLLMADGSIKHVRVFGRVIKHDTGRLECIGAVQD
ncbi:MAG: PAS domain S-box protein, partial [Mesorhizobium sp.]